jgi:pimeloyl-ACP methyl ester carboxylesterase
MSRNNNMVVMVQFLGKVYIMLGIAVEIVVIHPTLNWSSPPKAFSLILFTMLSTTGLLLVSTLASHALVRATPIPSQAPSIVWGACPDVSAPNLNCGQINVPLSYDDPSNSETITLSMARLKANGTSPSGSLLYNPGGPGVSGAQSAIAVSQGAYLFIVDLLEHYDIIAIDPRGTGASQPVTCDPALWNPRVNFRPQNESEFEAMVAHNKAFGESCRAKTGALIDHLDTVHVAKDFDVARQALGAEKLNYLGQSYGTHIGTTYAELFPDKIGRFVLDGVTDHTVSEVGFATDAAVTLEITLDKFFEWCNTTEECALHGLDAASIWDNLLAQAPIPAPGCVETRACRSDVTAEEIVFAVRRPCTPWTRTRSSAQVGRPSQQPSASPHKETRHCSLSHQPLLIPMVFSRL